MCRRVVMGPRLAEPTARILLLPSGPYNRASTAATQPGYALLMCGREIAMTRLPPSGAAHTYTNRQFCAARADDIAATHDGSGCFVLSRSEECVVQLTIDIGAYDDSLRGTSEDCEESGGLGRLLDTEESRQLYEELKDYFSVVQVVEGGKELGREIPLDRMERVCRGLGFFPTEREIEDMVNEV